MKEKMQKKLATQQAVMSVMEHHITVWQSVSALASLYDRFVINLKKIKDHLQVTEQDLDALEARIPILKKQLLERLHAVSGALAVYASEEGDRRLLKLADKKPSDLRKLKSAELARQAEKVFQAGKKLNEKDIREMKKAPKFHISGYGLTEKHLQNLQEALENYRQALKEFAESKASVRKSKAKLVKKIQENNQLLSRRIDRVILLFKEINPDFFEAYVRARKPPVKPGKGPSTAKSKRSSEKDGPSATKKASSAGKKDAAVGKKPTATKKAPVAKKTPAAKQVPAPGRNPQVAKQAAASVKKPAPVPKPSATGTQQSSSGES